VDCTIRHLSSGDVPLLEAMLAMFGEAFEEPDTYNGARPSRAYLSRLLAGDTSIAVAALDGETVVGAIAAYVLDKFEQERSEIYIYDLAVAETHRRRGIATAMIRAIQRIASERGAWVIFVQADQGDDPAIALYSKLGQREDVLHFDIPVRASPADTGQIP
jgi:aminoglycoside 3-N-acetyltransferase I